MRGDKIKPIWHENEKVVRLVDGNEEGLINNLNDLVEEFRAGNIECLCLVFRRKKEESTRTFFINPDNPHMFKSLVRLEHDMLGLYDEDATLRRYEE